MVAFQVSPPAELAFSMDTAPFPVQVLALQLRKQQRMVQALGSLYLRVRLERSFWFWISSAFAVAIIWVVNQWMEHLFACAFPFSVNLPIK